MKSHLPVGEPCEKCAQPRDSHRVAHEHVGRLARCLRVDCGLPRHCHRADTRTEKERKFFLGFDGEGRGRKPHRYTLLARASAEGRHQESIERESLTTGECLEFILKTPKHGVLVGFSLGYDWSMLLADMTKTEEGRKGLYELLRPQTRRRRQKRKGQSPYLSVKWTDPKTRESYRLNHYGSKFTVKRAWDSTGKKTLRVVWDVFKFFQGPFVDALEDWKIVDDATLAELRRMKKLRSEFDTRSPKEVRAYCFQECSALATLMAKLVDAHEIAGLDLEGRYHGAGSTSTSVLNLFNIKEKKRDPIPEMREAVASAFFGGRFEHSVVGRVVGPVLSYDISSAYPYAMTALPCLIHGTWERTSLRRRVESARAALVRYSLAPLPRETAWAPFPFRRKDGSMLYPASSDGGWIWRDEYLAGERLFPSHVRFHEAWVLESRCSCPCPFTTNDGRGLADFYRERLRIGKEGPGIVLKLGMNGGFGKTVQSVGENPPFQNWIWGGMITSSCRAQGLTLLGQHSDPWNVLGFATDGLFSRETLDPPQPRDTGTSLCYGPSGEEIRKPLGGWEVKTAPQGVFFARPGVYWPLSPTKDDLKKVRARGVGRLSILGHHKEIEAAWDNGERHFTTKESGHFEDDGSWTPHEMFWGALRCIRKRVTHGPLDERSDRPVLNITYTKTERYGRWLPRPLTVSFSPAPKRESEYDRDVECARTLLRSIPRGETSHPYRKAFASDSEGREQRQLRDEAWENS